MSRQNEAYPYVVWWARRGEPVYGTNAERDLGTAVAEARRLRAYRPDLDVGVAPLRRRYV